MEENQVLKYLNRKKSFLNRDYLNSIESLNKNIKNKKIIVLGGAGSIGSHTIKELLKYKARYIDIVDLNENGLVELVRDIRSKKENYSTEIKTYTLDIGSKAFEKMIFSKGRYDVWLNFAAIKHVRGERDPFTLMRMLEVNIFNLYKTLLLAVKIKSKIYFSVSTDKAADPINFMGASKKIMELVLGSYSNKIETKSARFGNVAFSDGSLLDSITKRFEKKQIMVSPVDIKRYFLTSDEAAKISLLSAFLACSGQIFVPKLNKKENQRVFLDIIKQFLSKRGFKIEFFRNERNARNNFLNCIRKKKWPCFIFNSETTGEKKEEKFVGRNEKVTKTSLVSLDSIEIEKTESFDLKKFKKDILNLKKKNKWNISDFRKIFNENLKSFKHYDTGKNLDEKI